MECSFMSFKFRIFLSRRIYFTWSFRKTEWHFFWNTWKNSSCKFRNFQRRCDVPFENCHEHSFQGSFEKYFDNVQDNLQFEQPCHSKKITYFFEGCYVFYDPMTDYMEKIVIWDSGLCVHNKDQIQYHWFSPLYFFNSDFD